MMSKKTLNKTFKKTFNKTLLASLISAMIVPATASIVREDVDYQDFRDFAENKGRFVAGATNIEIKDKSGNSLGYVLNGVPMPDFSSVHRTRATSTLIHPQYVVSVAHNNSEVERPTYWHYHIQFGSRGENYNPDAHHYDYAFVDKNNHPTWDKKDTVFNDYQTPRLHKLVTEVVESPVSDTTANTEQDYISNQKYLAFARLGAGQQGVMTQSGNLHNKDDKIHCSKMLGCTPYTENGYRYLTGGETLKFFALSKTTPTTERVLYAGGKETIANANGDVIHHLFTSPMANWNMSGDSGSPLFGFNKETNQWELISLVRGRGKTVDELYSYNSFIEVRPNFNQEKIKEDTIIINDPNSSTYQWFANTDGTSQLAGKTVGLTTSTLESSISQNGFTQLREDLNSGKTLEFQNKGTLELQNSINQGAGALYFNDDFTVTAKNQNDTWLGAGISVAKDKTVTWQVKNPEDDRLSKIGAGTLYVNGTGDNLGDISVGDGTVVLDQQNGKAFNQVGIVSGRATVKLANEQQIDPNKLYFGYRGGRLDMNGNNLTFNYIQNVDEGAQIVNHHPIKEANITVIGNNETDIKNAFNENKDNRGSVFGNATQGFYRLSGVNQSPLPDVNNSENGGINSNVNWTYLTSDNTKKFTILEKQFFSVRQKNAFNGILGETDNNKFNGKLNVTYDPSQNQNAKDYTWLLSGGSNLNGNLNVKAGEVILSGRPTPYALDIEMKPDADGKYTVLKKKQEIFKEDDWINRQFNATTFKVENEGKLYIGRNVSHVNTNFDLSNQAFAQLGFVQGQTPVCIRSDYHGETSCEQPIYTANTLNTIPTTQIQGNLNLKDNSQLTLGKAHLTGSSMASPSSQMNMLENAHWTMTNNSQVGNLTMTQGSQISLNAQPNTQYNTLTILGNLMGKGRFNYLTNLTNNQSDKVVVQGTAEGEYGLYVQNSGTEPVYREEYLTLLSLQNANQANKQLTVELLNPDNYVDLGAYRYSLENNGKDYYLFNSRLNAKEVTQKGESVKADALKPYDGEISTKGSGVTHELPVGHLEMKGESVKADALKPYDGIITTKGESVTHELPVGHLEMKGSGVTHELPAGHLEMKGESVKAEPLPVGHLEMKGESVKADALKPYDGIITTKGESVKAEPLPAIDIQKVLNTTTPQLPTVTPPQSAVISRYTNTALSDLSANANQLIRLGQNLHHRIIHDQAEGIWVDTKYETTNYQSNLFRPYQTDESTISAGIGKSIILKNDKTLTLGIAGTQSKAEHDYDEGITGESKLNLVSLYGKLKTSRHHFISFDIGSGESSNDILFDNTKTSISRKALDVGLGVGHHFKTKFVNITPSLGLRYQHLSANDYTLNQAKVLVDDGHIINYQAGLTLEKDFTLANGLIVKPLLSSYYVDASNHQNQTDVYVNNHKFVQAYGKYQEHKVGVGVGNGTWAVMLDASLMNGDEIDKKHAYGLLLNYQW